MSRAPFQSIAVALPILASIGLATAPSHAANGIASCRFRAGGSLDQIVMIDVPQGATAATVTAIVEESPELSGSTQYSRDQLTSLNALILAHQANNDPAYRSAPGNQVQCMVNAVADAVARLGKQAQ